jgi:HlyD family secretion protein
MQITINSNKKSMKKWLLSLIIISLFGVSATIYLKTRQAVSKPDITALTVPVKSETLKMEIQTSGIVRPIQSVNISPQQAGRVVKIYVEQGEQVKQGQIIAQMENDEIQGQILEAQANLSRAKARLAELIAVSRIEEIAQASARLEKSQSNLTQLKKGNRKEIITQTEAKLQAAIAKEELAIKRVNRYEFLLNEGAISQDKLDENIAEKLSTEANRKEIENQLLELKNGYRREEISIAEAEVKEAKEALKELQNGSTPEVIAQAKATVDEAEAKLFTIKTQAKNTIIKAPFSGIITQRYADTGAFVTPTTSASSSASATSTSIVALAKGLKIIAEISEIDISKISIGQPVNIIADAYADQPFQGYVSLIAPEAIKDQNVTLFQIQINLETGQDQLLSGMNVRINITGKEIPNALFVPSIAVVTKNGQKGVLVADENNQPKFRPVTIGSIMDNQTQIIEGIKASDKIFLNDSN